ncbi:MAG: NfeD family protein [Acidobacteria bacterium]|nr:NfeD family protein [Acidobacteriota bacterium]
MEPWVVWLVAAAVLVALELASGTFYLLVMAAGPLAGALLARWGQPVWFQLLGAAAVSGAGALILRHARKKGRLGAGGEPMACLDIGQTVRVEAWSGAYATRARYRGAEWDVELEPSARGDAPPPAGEYVIVDVRGSRLIVGPPR